MRQSAKDILTLYRAKGLRIATAESCTGGMLAAAITNIAGSSDVFDRGFVTYSNAAKSDMLGVSAQTLATHGAVSEPVAREMAEGALAASAGDVALSITGIAGPGGSDFKPETVEFGALGRDRVRSAATDHALSLLLTAAQQA